VTLHAPIESIRRWVPSHWGAVEPIDDHSCEYRTADDDLDWLALRLMMFRVDFEVHEPEELREHLRMLSERLRRAGVGVR
jgi:predicted DNA-binding transcriptional regulator YafY